MLQKLKRRDEGFTIIETLIVLAIAGLIMLIVFLAVPALERSSRNTQRKNDASNTFSSINTYVNNNGGTIPNNQATLTSSIADVNLGIYTSGDVFYSATPQATAHYGGTAAAGYLNENDIIYIPGYTCSAGEAAAPTAGSPREYALQYAVETGSSAVTMQCLSS
jgi:prepilin-type N-terminal cleavage/methylation domain-containing protein